MHDAPSHDGGVTVEQGLGFGEVEARLVSRGVGSSFLGMTGFVRYFEGETCSRQSVGRCVLRTCASPLLPDGGRPARVPVSAGHISIAGPNLSYEFTMEGAIYGARVLGLGPSWSGGEELTFTATGGEVLAFVTRLRFPGTPRVTFPEQPRAPMTLALDRQRPFEVRWEPIPVGEVVFHFAQRETTGSQYTGALLECRFPGDAGRGVVSPEELTALSTTAYRTSVEIGGQVDTQLRRGEYDVSVRAFTFTWGAELSLQYQ